MFQILRQRLEGVQRYLNFEHIEGHPSFTDARVRVTIRMTEIAQLR